MIKTLASVILLETILSQMTGPLPVNAISDADTVLCLLRMLPGEGAFVESAYEYECAQP